MQTLKTKMALLVGLSLFTLPTQATNIDALIQAGEDWHMAQAESQERVNKLANETRDLDAEYERIVRQIEG
ncbi:MAG: DUF3450 family protein, partial [Salinisphaeraceae bacterium]|nr:DUF3450 family protein [Salinisphaeraceae bacterium]